MTTAAVWTVYGDLAALVVASLLIGRLGLLELRKIRSVLEDTKLEAAEHAAADVMFGNKQASRFDGFFGADDDVASIAEFLERRAARKLEEPVA